MEINLLSSSIVEPQSDEPSSTKEIAVHDAAEESVQANLLGAVQGNLTSSLLFEQSLTPSNFLEDAIHSPD